MPLTPLVVMAADSMLRRAEWASTFARRLRRTGKLEAGDFTTLATLTELRGLYVEADCGASASLTFEA